MNFTNSLIDNVRYYSSSFGISSRIVKYEDVINFIKKNPRILNYESDYFCCLLEIANHEMNKRFVNINIEGFKKIMNTIYKLKPDFDLLKVYFPYVGFNSIDYENMNKQFYEGIQLCKKYKYPINNDTIRNWIFSMISELKEYLKNPNSMYLTKEEIEKTIEHTNEIFKEFI